MPYGVLSEVGLPRYRLLLNEGVRTTPGGSIMRWDCSLPGTPIQYSGVTDSSNISGYILREWRLYFRGAINQMEAESFWGD